MPFMLPFMVEIRRISISVLEAGTSLAQDNERNYSVVMMNVREVFNNYC